MMDAIYQEIKHLIQIYGWGATLRALHELAGERAQDFRDEGKEHFARLSAIQQMQFHDARKIEENEYIERPSRVSQAEAIRRQSLT
jgi:hypothetical protein